MPRLLTSIHIKAMTGLLCPDSTCWLRKLQKRVLKTGQFPRSATWGLGNRYVSTSARFKPAQRIGLPRKCLGACDTASNTVSKDLSVRDHKDISYATKDVYLKPTRDRCTMLGLTLGIPQYTRSAQRSSGQLCTLGCQPVCSCTCSPV